MSCEGAIGNLLGRFVEIYGDATDFELSKSIEPKLWFFDVEGYLKDDSEREEATKYFLLSASLYTSRLTGNSRNARILLNALHSQFLRPDKSLYSVEKENLYREIERVTRKCRLYGKFGKDYGGICDLLSSVNNFINARAFKQFA